jgi:hypothetical protein
MAFKRSPRTDNAPRRPSASELSEVSSGGSQAQGNGPPAWRCVRLVVVDAPVALVLLLDEVARPLFRPLISWFARLRIVARVERAIAGLPPYAILAVLAVPFAVVEPLKIAGLVLIGVGQVKSGVAILVVAHAGSFLLVERIYSAGRVKLMTIGWFARLMAGLARIRDVVLARTGAMRLFRAARRAVRRLRAQARRWQRRFVRLFA